MMVSFSISGKISFLSLYSSHSLVSLLEFCIFCHGVGRQNSFPVVFSIVSFPFFLVILYCNRCKVDVFGIWSNFDRNTLEFCSILTIIWLTKRPMFASPDTLTDCNFPSDVSLLFCRRILHISEDGFVNG